MDTNILIGLLSGTVAGWVVSIFSQPYNTIRKLVLKQINPRNTLSILLIEMLMPLFGLTTLLLIAMIIAAVF